MRVKVMNRVYRMDKKEYSGLLKIASEQVPFGIYAIEKGDYAELANIKCKSNGELKQHKRQLRAEGFKVFANGKQLARQSEQ